MWLPLGALRQLKRNPQYLTESQMTALRGAIERDGFLVPILVRPIGDGKFEIVSGNHRVLALRELGATEAPCLVADLSDDRAAALAINLNTIHGEPSVEQLAPFLAELSDEALATVHLDAKTRSAVTDFDAELRQKLAALELPKSLDRIPDRTPLKTCCCVTCGKVHFV